jgi:hypothetical protein
LSGDSTQLIKKLKNTYFWGACVQRKHSSKPVNGQEEVRLVLKKDMKRTEVEKLKNLCSFLDSATLKFPKSANLPKGQAKTCQIKLPNSKQLMNKLEGSNVWKTYVDEYISSVVDDKIVLSIWFKYPTPKATLTKAISKFPLLHFSLLDA